MSDPSEAIVPFIVGAVTAIVLLFLVAAASIYGNGFGDGYRTGINECFPVTKKLGG